MLRFFRQIRKKLMEQNKVRTYLLYATGEIALVVIGILIALQINNWNEQRKQLHLADQYLEEIVFNLEKDIDLIDSVIVFNTIKIGRLSKSIDHYFKWEEDERFRDSLAVKVSDGFIANTQLFRANRTALEAILGSGNLNILPKDIRIKITEYYDAATLSEEENERALMLTRDALQDKLLKSVITREVIAQSMNLSISTGEVEEEPFKADLSIVIDMGFLSFIEAERVTNLEILKLKAKELISLIEK